MAAGLAHLHRRALEATGRVVSGIGDEDWDADSPCEGQTVREVLNHLVAGNLWAAEVMAGRTIAEVGDRLDGDLLGVDPKAAYDESAVVAGAAFAGDGAMGRPVAVSYGPVPGEVYARHRFFDVFVHGWDLAKGTGQDTTLDPDLLAACAAAIEPDLDAFRRAGALGQPLPVADDADAQTRFLAQTGRRA
ncbi:MAG: TIGR03086 family metal-binding protein [Acidimicrobiales bacterium]